MIYHGGVDEFYEKKFHPGRDYAQIRQNLIIHKKNRKSLWARQFSGLAAFFLYHHTSTVSLGEKPLFDAKKYKAFEKQRQMELTYHFFRLEFLELLSLFRGGGSVLLLVTPPLNLDRVPGEVCSNAITPEVKGRQEGLEALLERGEAARAAVLGDALVLDFSGNALSFYLRGRAYKAMGKFRHAKSSLYRVGLYDCDSSHGSIVFNKIMVTLAEKQNLTVIDFNSMVNSDFGEEGIFVENLFPGKAYYRRLIGVLEKEAVKALKTL